MSQWSFFSGPPPFFLPPGAKTHHFFPLVPRLGSLDEYSCLLCPPPSSPFPRKKRRIDTDDEKQLFSSVPRGFGGDRLGSIQSREKGKTKNISRATQHAALADMEIYIIRVRPFVVFSLPEVPLSLFPHIFKVVCGKRMVEKKMSREFESGISTASTHSFK